MYTNKIIMIKVKYKILLKLFYLIMAIIVIINYLFIFL